MKTTNAVTHTPTPWKMFDDKISPLDWKLGTEKTNPEEPWSFIAQRLTYENATFIVNSVNCHEELVSTLEYALNFLKGDPTKSSIQMVNKLKQAVAKAEGGK